MGLWLLAVDGGMVFALSDLPCHLQDVEFVAAVRPGGKSAWGSMLGAGLLGARRQVQVARGTEVPSGLAPERELFLTASGGDL